MANPISVIDPSQIWAYWSLDGDETTSLEDGSGNSRNLIKVGTPVQVTDKDLFENRAYGSLNGSNYLWRESFGNINAKYYSISIWFKNSSISADNYLFSIGNTSTESSPAIGILVAAGGTAYAFISGGYVSLGANLTTDTWYHIVITQNSTTAKILLNKVLKYIGTVTSAAAYDNIYFGTGYFDAGVDSIDEIRIDERTITDGGVTSLEDIATGEVATLFAVGVNALAVANPTFLPVAGSYSTTQSVVISSATAGATIYYTDDGTDPTTSSTVYTTPIILESSKTLKAFAVKSPMTDSSIITAAYTIAAKVATPTFSPAAGSYTGAKLIEILCANTEATIYYTIDGTTPTIASTLYIGKIAIYRNTTIKALAIKTGFTNSDVGSAAYTIVNTPELLTGLPYSIRVFGTDLILQGELDCYETLIFQRKMYSAGVFTLTIDYNIPAASLLQKNKLIMLYNNVNKVGIIKEIKYLQQGDKEKLTITGFELKGIFKQRITIPTVSETHQSWTTEPIETIMKELIQYQCIDITAMAFPDLVVETDAASGTTLSFETRYKNLADELEKIGKVTEMGYVLNLDFSIMKYVFNVLPGVDHTITSGDPIIFSTEYDNIENQEYIDSDINMGNYAIVAGQGTGTARTIIETGTALTGIEKNVVFVDARDINTTDELTARGTSKLAETATAQAFNCKVYPNRTFIYETDWNLGDKVTIRNAKLGISVDRRIEEITEYYSAGKTREIQVVFGNTMPSLKKYIDLKNDVGID